MKMIELDEELDIFEKENNRIVINSIYFQDS